MTVSQEKFYLGLVVTIILAGIGAAQLSTERNFARIEEAVAKNSENIGDLRLFLARRGANTRPMEPWWPDWTAPK